MKKPEIVLVPATGAGHLKSAVEFAKCLIHRHDGLSITILVIKELYSSYLDTFIKSFSSSYTQSRIKLIELPQVELPTPERLKTKPLTSFIDYVESHKPIVRDILTNIISSCSNSDSQLVGLIVDMFCVSMIDVANEFDLDSYLFFTCSAGFLDLMLHLPNRHNQIAKEFRDSDSELWLPSFRHPVPPGVLPPDLFNGNDGYPSFVRIAARFKETRGIMVNTFSELENHALNSFSHGDSLPIYAVGPLIDLKGSQIQSDLERDKRNKIMKWLDDQPPSSVVFLCFGSMGTFSVDQVKEIAIGLERSKHRFLWSLRVAMPNSLLLHDCERPEEILPDGFMDQIEGKGMICGWTPQVEVLGHRSIGGFVSHCGWNSVLESLWFGVPIATWPMYAEQHINAFEMVKELGMAVELRLDYGKRGDDMVAAAEIERAVRCLMERESEVRKKVKEIGETGRKAVINGGSSFVEIGRLIEDMVDNC